MAQLQQSQEFVKKIDSAKVRQTPVIAGNYNVSWRIFHLREFLTFG